MNARRRLLELLSGSGDASEAVGGVSEELAFGFEELVQRLERTLAEMGRTSAQRALEGWEGEIIRGIWRGPGDESWDRWQSSVDEQARVYLDALGREDPADRIVSGEATPPDLFQIARRTQQTVVTVLEGIARSFGLKLPALPLPERPSDVATLDARLTELIRSRTDA